VRPAHSTLAFALLDGRSHAACRNLRQTRRKLRVSPYFVYWYWVYSLLHWQMQRKLQTQSLRPHPGCCRKGSWVAPVEVLPSHPVPRLPFAKSGVCTSRAVATRSLAAVRVAKTSSVSLVEDGARRKHHPFDRRLDGAGRL